MFFSKFNISFFRSFQEAQTLKFAVPNEDITGSGITYIVGENNSGKTTVIEGLFMKDQERIRSSEKQLKGDPVFELYDIENSLIKKVELIRKGAYTFIEKPKGNTHNLFEIVPSRRHWVSTAHGSQSLEMMVDSSIKKSPRSNGNPSYVASALRDIESNEVKYNNFISFVKRVLPDFSSFATAFEDNEFIEYSTSNGVKHRSDFLGDGVISILRILAHIFLNKQRPLIIDEPELSLHPSAQKRLLSIIAEAAKCRQIILSTHSPYLISWKYIENGAKLNKIAKEGDLNSKIYHLVNYSKYQRLVKGANWSQPFLMDVVSKEIFFNENILFVEGQEDVGLLKQENDIIESVNLFGYGVRGKDAFEFAFQLSKDLGIKKACALLDNGREESEIKTKLENEFPGYKVVQWDRDDIRDKKPRKLKEKTGYFNVKGKKKKDADLGDYNQKIESINSYFST